MKNLKETLIALQGFVNNEYLDKYVQIIERNKFSKNKSGVVNRHHIIPKVWYKLHNHEVDNNPSNLVTLPYREHALAHYYLCLCTSDSLQYANQMALICLMSRKKMGTINMQLIKNLPLYDNIYESYIKNRKSNRKLY